MNSVSWDLSRNVLRKFDGGSQSVGILVEGTETGRSECVTHE